MPIQIRCLIFVLILVTSVFCQHAKATHIRAGEMTAVRDAISPTTYHFTLTIYRDTSSIINADQATIYFNDGTPAQTFGKTSSYLILGAATEVNIFKFSHTFSGIGVFRPFYVGENRNRVVNIINSEENKFHIETEIVIDPFIDLNDSPILTNPPIDEAVIGQIYTHNPGAYDPDGDSLSYEIIPSKNAISIGNNQFLAVPATGYQRPDSAAGGQNETLNGPAFMRIDPKTGLVTWNVPRNKIGNYNFAIKITEWRNGYEIGYVVRDMQILVSDSRNKAPLIKIPQDTCIMAGSSINGTIVATDPDGDILNLTSAGGVYILTNAPKASFTTRNPQRSPAQGSFVWNTSCENVRKEPYDVIFKVEDNPKATPKLSKQATWRITVVGPAPTNLKTTVAAGAIQLNWDTYNCTNAKRIEIYRKNGTTNFTPGVCETGIPDNLGFKKIAEVDKNAVTFTDDNNGLGLRKSINYCYRLVAVFEERGEKINYSIASEEACAMLKIEAPLLTNVSILATDSLNGRLFIRWTRALELDTAAFAGPYEYRLFRKTGANSINPLVQVYSTNNMADTTFTDSLLNTKDSVYNYQLAFYYNASGNRTLKDSTLLASSVRLVTIPDVNAINLNWTANVPWTNTGFYHYIYRNGLLIDSVLANTAANFTYTDRGKGLGDSLQKRVSYCYSVITQGSYGTSKFLDTLLNASQIACAMTKDTVPPCIPNAFEVKPNPFQCATCLALKDITTFTNTLSWSTTKTGDCDNDVAKYNIYYTPHIEDSLGLIASVTDSFFVHKDLTSLAGCYQIAAVDSSGNMGKKSAKFCRDNCPSIDLPNTFTPNADNVNEAFSPICISRVLVRNARFLVYNRWGKKIYEQQYDNYFEREKDISWDGKITGENQPAPAGVYYYLLELNFKRLSRKDEKQSLKGWIQLIR